MEKFLSSRKELTRFLGERFRVLEGVVEQVYTEEVQRYHWWDCVRCLDAEELGALELTEPAVEFRADKSPERFIVWREGQVLKLKPRLWLVRSMTTRGVTCGRSDVLQGMAWKPLVQILRDIGTWLELKHGRNGHRLMRELPNWTEFSTEELYGARRSGPERVLLMPANEIGRSTSFVVTRRPEFQTTRTGGWLPVFARTSPHA